MFQRADCWQFVLYLSQHLCTWKKTYIITKKRIRMLTDWLVTEINLIQYKHVSTLSFWLFSLLSNVADGPDLIRANMWRLTDGVFMRCDGIWVHFGAAQVSSPWTGINIRTHVTALRPGQRKHRVWRALDLFGPTLPLWSSLGWYLLVPCRSIVMRETLGCSLCVCFCVCMRVWERERAPLPGCVYETEGATEKQADRL